MCFVVVIDSSLGKFAGEKRRWQAAKTKILKKCARQIPRHRAGRRAHGLESADLRAPVAAIFLKILVA
jgi:hypothetical protein